MSAWSVIPRLALSVMVLAAAECGDSPPAERVACCYRLHGGAKNMFVEATQLCEKSRVSECTEEESYDMFLNQCILVEDALATALQRPKATATTQSTTITTTQSAPRQTSWTVDCGAHGQPDPNDDESCICDEGWESNALAMGTLCDVPVQVQNEHIANVAAEVANSESNTTSGTGSSSVIVTGVGGNNSTFPGITGIPLAGMLNNPMTLGVLLVLLMCICCCCASCCWRLRKASQSKSAEKESLTQTALALQQLKLQLAQLETQHQRPVMPAAGLDQWAAAGVPQQQGAQPNWAQHVPCQPSCPPPFPIAGNAVQAQGPSWHNGPQFEVPTNHVDAQPTPEQQALGPPPASTQLKALAAAYPQSKPLEAFQGFAPANVGQPRPAPTQEGGVPGGLRAAGRKSTSKVAAYRR